MLRRYLSHRRHVMENNEHAVDGRCVFMRCVMRLCQAILLALSISASSEIQRTAAAGDSRVSTAAPVPHWRVLSPAPGSPSFLGPHGLATDAAGNVYVADTWNDRIEELVRTR